MAITLETLDLDEARLQIARDEIQRNAYFKWEKAGCPEGGDPMRFWREAEYEWIEFHYVPSRPFEQPEKMASQAPSRALLAR